MGKHSLLHCPFCGNGGHEISYPPRSAKNMFSGTRYVVMCTECGGHTGYCESPGEAVARWNTRAQTLDDCAPVQKLKNERGAGRKPKNWNVKNMLAERRAGWTYRKIAKMRGLSVGTVHKLISEQSKNEVS